MKNSFKKYWALVLKYWWVILILIVIFVFGLQKCQINKLKDQVQLQNVELSTLNDSVTYYVSKDSTLTAKVLSVSIEKDNAKKALELAGFKIKDLRQRDIKKDNVIFALNAKIVALGKGTIIFHDSITPGRVDSIPVKTGKWNDRFLFLDPILTGNKMDFKYQYQTGIKILDEKAGKSYVVSAYLVDPNNPKLTNPFAKITTANSITITPKKPWVGWRILEDVASFVAGALLIK